MFHHSQVVQPSFSPNLAFRFNTSNYRPIILHFTSGAFSRTEVAELIVALQRILSDYDETKGNN